MPSVRVLQMVTRGARWPRALLLAALALLLMAQLTDSATGKYKQGFKKKSL